MINFVTKERSDAIKIVDSFLLERLKRIYPKINHLQLNGKGRNLFSTFIKYLKSIFQLIKQSKSNDLIYFSAPDMYGAYFNLIYNFPLTVVSIHHTEKDLLFNEYWTGKSLRSFDYYVGTSEFSKEQLINDWNVPEGRIFVNYCGISEDYYPEKIEKFLPYKYILYVGDEYPRKNLENILKALKRLLQKYPDIKFVKLGKVRSDENRKKTDNMIKELGLQYAVVLKREFVSESELRKYYSNAEVFLLPSLLEGFAQTSAEAMACGCPVITSNFKPMTETVGDTQILIDPNDYEKMAEKIIEVLDNSELKDQLSAQAIERAKMFNWNKYADRMAKIFDEILTKHSNG